MKSLTHFFLFYMVSLALLCGCRRSVQSVEAPEYQHALMRQARAAELANNYHEAAAIYQKVLLKHPTMATAHLQLAYIYHDSIKDYIEAIHHYRRYCAMRPGSDKEEMIKGRIQKAEQMLASQAVRRISANDPSGQLALMKQLDQLNTNLARAEAEKQQLQATNTLLRARAEQLDGRVEQLERLVASLSYRPDSATREGGGHRPGGSRPSGAGGGHTYEVRPGETLSKIAHNIYGDAALWPRIRDANPGKTGRGDTVKAGDVLVIPLLE